MKSVLKAIVLTFLGIVAFFILLICGVLFLLNYHGYGGEHKDLYTVAVNNVFAISGHESNGELSYDPEIYVVEKDDYGRTLFFYSEYYDGFIANEPNYAMAFGIMQKSDKRYVYYYRDVSCQSYFDSTDDWSAISAKLPPDYLDALKEANDWNKALDEERCTKVKISNKKPEGKLRPKDYEFDEILCPYIVKNGYTGEDDSICRFFRYSQTDKFGRELFYVYGSAETTGKNGQTQWEHYDFVVILNADGTCPENGIAVIEEITTCDEVICQLKKATNWNTSP